MHTFAQCHRLHFYARLKAQASIVKGLMGFLESSVLMLEHTCTIINVFSVCIILVGLIFTSIRYMAQFGKLAPPDNFKQFKVDFGNVLTLGLEILVLGDVIYTIIVPPTIESLLFLTFIILIRTIVSWTLNLETHGCWPWQIASRRKV